MGRPAVAVKGARDVHAPGRPERPSRASQVARIAVLECELQLARQALRDADDARLLKALLLGTQGCVFTVGDVFARVALDADLSAAIARLTPKQLGKRLARLADRELDGLTVRHVLETADGWVWHIDFHGDAGAAG